MTEHKHDKPQVEHARLIAMAAHFGQVDKGGRPIFEHVEHVAMQFTEWIHMSVAYLHDTLEDSPLTSVGALVFLCEPEIVGPLIAITRKVAAVGYGKEPYFEYIGRLKQDPIARAVKIADLRHNMDRSRWPEMPDSYYEREEKALKILMEAHE